MRTYYRYSHPVFGEKIVSSRPRLLGLLFPALWAIFHLRWGLLVGVILIQAFMTTILNAVFLEAGFGSGLPREAAESSSWLVAGALGSLAAGVMVSINAPDYIRRRLEERGFELSQSGDFHTKDEAIARWASE